MDPKRFVSAILFVVALAAAAISAQTEGAAIIARDEPAEGIGNVSGSRAYGASGSVASSGAKTASGKKPAATRSRTVAKAAPPKPKAWNGFVVGDKYTFLNFEVVSAEKPWHTREAKANGAKGLVQVEVLIDTDGSVIQARARTGNKMLHPEAERAALASKFGRPTFGGKPARAIGFLVYRFGPDDED